MARSHTTKRRADGEGMVRTTTAGAVKAAAATGGPVGVTKRAPRPRSLAQQKLIRARRDRKTLKDVQRARVASAKKRWATTHGPLVRLVRAFVNEAPHGDGTQLSKEMMYLMHDMAEEVVKQIISFAVATKFVQGGNKAQPTFSERDVISGVMTWDQKYNCGIFKSFLDEHLSKITGDAESVRTLTEHRAREIRNTFMIPYHESANGAGAGAGAAAPVRAPAPPRTPAPPRIRTVPVAPAVIAADEVPEEASEYEDEDEPEPEQQGGGVFATFRAVLRQGEP
jgi:hypothetical protein